jgi:hypothetical protein
MPTTAPAKAPITPQALQSRTKFAFDQIKVFVHERGNERLRELWPDWKDRFTAIYEQSNLRPEVAISLVGGTGAGKSTLLNALIGARVLPVSNMRACTAAITEVAYEPGKYRARIEFISRESWEAEIDQLLEDLRDAKLADSENGDSAVPAEMSRAVRDKLWAVYKPSDDAEQSDFDPFDLKEPLEIKRALDAGGAEVTHDSIDEFRKRVAQFLDSSHRYWPIVKSVTVRGPFEPLRDGAKIIDLPGLNDPNEAREEVTKRHLKTCRYVWIVFNIKRALTKDTMNLMQSDDFVRQIVMDGRSDALTFVGTASDDVDTETGIEEFRLPDDAEPVEVVAARNREVRKVVHAQLDELAGRLATLAREQRATANDLSGKLKASKIFTVSAREFLRLRRLARTNSAGFDDEPQTEIPALLSHMRSTCAGYGVTAHCESLERQLNLLIQEVNREVKSQLAAIDARAQINERQRKEMGAAVSSARNFLDNSLQDAHERLVQDLEASEALLGERLKRAIDRARTDLRQTLSRWERIHWATLRAVCRRGGVHTGSTGTNDLPADLAKPILDSIAFTWSDFFGDKLHNTMEKWKEFLLAKADDFRRRLIEALGSAGDFPQNLIDGLDGILGATDKVLDELLGQTLVKVDERITQDQRTLYESLPERVKANMAEAFELAAAERGSGMKRRMVEILSGHADRVANVMFDDARAEMMGGVRGLRDWLAREYTQMTDVVRRHASLAADNLSVGSGQLSAEAIAAEQQRLAELQSIIAAIAKQAT